MKTFSIERKNIIRLFLGAFFIICVIAPIMTMLTKITPEGFSSIVGTKQFNDAVVNTVTTALTATVISLSLAMLAAWYMNRVDIRFKSVFSIIFVVPMLIPSISHAFGLIALFGANGMITNLLHLSSGIYGFWGIVTGSVMYSFPIAFLMFSSTLQYEDGLPYRAAEILGIPSANRFFGITLPYLKKTIISCFFAVFTMIVTDYGVPLLVGGKKITLSVLMYNKAVGMLDYDTGSVVGAFLLIPAVAAFVVDLINPEYGQNSFVSEKVQNSRTKASRISGYIYCTFLCLCVIAPILSFCLMVFETKYPVNTTPTVYHIMKTLNRGAGTYLLNSLIYSLLTMIVGTFVSFVCAYMTSRVGGKSGKILHLASLTSMAVPGLVLGLSYVIFFKNSNIYGTIIIIMLVNSVHFFASPYLMMYNSLGKVNANLEDVGLTLGIGKLSIIKDVILPKVRYTIYEMAIYFFVNSMMTISAVSFLAPPSPKPVALMINQFEAQLLMESAAFVSLMIMLINLAIKIWAQFRIPQSDDRV